MKGIRKRITIAFMSIVALLFFSGMISFFELRVLSNETEEILKANSRNIELAREMLDAADDQSRAFMHLAVFGRTEFDSLCRSSMERIEMQLAVAQEQAIDRASLDSLSYAVSEMRILTDDFLAFGAGADAGYIDVDWYDNTYQNSYVSLTTNIRRFMTSTQSSLAPRTEQLKKNAFRAVTPVLISLVVMIAIVLMFYFFVLIYYVNPILKMNKGLGNYLAFKTPFDVKSEFRDEMAELKEKIETLITMVKQSSK